MTQNEEIVIYKNAYKTYSIFVNGEREHRLEELLNEEIIFKLEEALKENEEGDG